MPKVVTPENAKRKVEFLYATWS